MNNRDYNRFFELVGSDSENYNETEAKSVSCEEYIAECMDLIKENPLEYESVACELETLSFKFWNHVQSN